MGGGIGIVPPTLRWGYRDSSTYYEMGGGIGIVPPTMRWGGIGIVPPTMRWGRGLRQK